MEEIKLSELVHFLPRQLEATKVADDHAYTLYGGSAGPGKSYWLRWYPIRTMILWGQQYGLRGIHGALFSKDYTTLKDRQMSKMEVECPRWLGSIQSTKTDGLGFHINKRYGGHVLLLRNLDDPSKYLSSEFAIVAQEEVTENDEDTFHKLRGRLRWTGIPNPRWIGATNPGGIGHCIPFGEVITRQGFIDIKDVRVGEEVLTLLEDGSQGFVPIVQKITEKFQGKLLHSENWSARFVATPEHKIAILTETKNSKGRTFHSPSLRKVCNLANTTRLPSIGEWHGEHISKFTIPEVKTRKLKVMQPLTLNGDDYCALMGWYLSEGSFRIAKGGQRFEISQMKPKNRKMIQELLLRCGFSFRQSHKGFTIFSPSWAHYLSQFGKCRDKFVPDSIKRTDVRQIAIFMDAMISGDGHGKHYYTTSQRLADDVQEIFHKMGLRTYLSSRQRYNRKGLSYDVSSKENKMGWIEKRKIKAVPYNGLVYCIGIENLHRFYLRQNGTIFLSGNSFAKKLWIDRVYSEEMRPLASEFAYVKALPKDNPYLAVSYLATLDSLPENLRKAYRDGNWDVFEGQYFTEWDASRHVVKPFPIPVSWFKFRSIDPSGREGVTSCHWYAVDQNGRVFCVAPETKILRADLNWVEAGTIEVGDVLAGFDEHVPESKKRLWKKSVVEKVERIMQPSYRLTLSDGKEIVCSENHQWLMEATGRKMRHFWSTTKDLKVGWKMLKVLDTWERDTSWGGGYLAGAFDGEGHLTHNQRGTLVAGLAQKDNALFARVREELDKRGIVYSVGRNRGTHGDVMSLTICRKRDVLRLMGSVRPERLLPKVDFDGFGGFVSFDQPVVVKKEYLGMREVVAMQTSSRTYIAEGLASHNCYREYYMTGRDLDEHARAIQAMSCDREGVQEDYRYTVIDAAAFAKAGYSETSAEIFERNGVTGLLPAAKERVVGWNAVHTYLRWSEGTSPQKPLLQVFENCYNMARTIPMAQHDDLHPEDVASNSSPFIDSDKRSGTEHQDAIDDLRYFLRTLRETKTPKPLTIVERKLQEFRLQTSGINFDYKYQR